jgi:PAS domain S-box-containing protein
MADDQVNILLVDDQPGKLLTYEAILRDLGANLITANGAREALEHLLKKDMAVVLIDVYMPETDGFELAAMIREHPRFRDTAIIFISAVLLNDVDRLRGYEMGAVDYVPVPVIPEMLRAKVNVFVDLYRKRKQLAQLNRDLEARVAERTVALAASAMQLKQSEQLRSLALAAGQMGSWEWDAVQKRLFWDQGQYSIFGVDPDTFVATPENVRRLVHPADTDSMTAALNGLAEDAQTVRTEFRVLRPNGETRWCIGVAAASFDGPDHVARISGVTIDITERKLAEERQTLLAEEVDHRARNVVAVIQSIMRLSRSDDVDTYLRAVDGRIRALSNAHKLLSRSRWEGADLGKLVDEEFAPYKSDETERVFSEGPPVLLQPSTAQTLALALHEMATNAAKYGALSVDRGSVRLTWKLAAGRLTLHWQELAGPEVAAPRTTGYGTRVVRAGIEHQLGGTVAFDWASNGLQCTMVIPHDEKAEKKRGAVKASERAAPDASTLVKIAAGEEVLLVEDEPIIGMMLTDMLSELGLKVDGPHSTLADAMVAAKSGRAKAAILDVNLKGEKIYPVAEALHERDIPFIFITGYGADSIDPRFQGIALLQKPIERQKLRNLLLNGLSSERLPEPTQPTH